MIFTGKKKKDTFHEHMRSFFFGLPFLRKIGWHIRRLFNRREKRKKLLHKKFASSANRTRASSMATMNSTTRPMMRTVHESNTKYTMYQYSVGLIIASIRLFPQLFETTIFNIHTSKGNCESRRPKDGSSGCFKLRDSS